MTTAVPPRSLYVHVPFCAHRCGYCDFVTVTGHPELHAGYADALIVELDLAAAAVPAAPVDLSPGAGAFDTVFIGGGTPTLLQPAALQRLLQHLAARLAPGAELTIECNPETVTPALARLLVSSGVTRVSLGAQSFDPAMLEVLERRATPDIVRAAAHELRSAGIGQLNLDLIWGIPGQHLDGLDRDLSEVIAIAPDHVSAYELEFKPGTRLARAHPDPLADLDPDVDDFYERAIDTLGAAGFAWYETANFARAGAECRHNLAYWTQADHLAIGVGAVGTIAGERRTNLPNIVRYLAAVDAGERPPVRIEHLDAHTRATERVLLGLRLARPLTITAADLDDERVGGAVVNRAGLLRLADMGLLDSRSAGNGDVEIELRRRGRLLLNSVLGELLA